MSYRDQHYGALVINWKSRKATWYGMDGCEDMSAAEVLDLFKAHRQHPNVWVAGLIFWTDNDQLCVHDEAGFLADATEDVT